MALALPAELLTAQTAQSRKPVIDVIAGRLQADFPFTGNPIANTAGTDQGVSCPVILGDGSLAILYAGPGKSLSAVISDPDQTSFASSKVIDTDYSRSVTDISAVVLPEGNIAAACQLSTDTLTVYRVSASGDKVSEKTFSSLSTLAGVAICATDTGVSVVYARTDGTASSLYLMQSTDFATWSVPTLLSVPGLGTVFTGPALQRTADGGFILVVSVESGTVCNLWASTSTDLSTWGEAFALTSTSAINIDYVNPAVSVGEDGSIFVATEVDRTYLSIDHTAAGYVGDPYLAMGEGFVDEATGKLYVTAKTWPGGGAKSILKIDIDSWTIDHAYGGKNVSGYPEFFSDRWSIPWAGNSSNGITVTTSEFGVCVIDFPNDDIRSFFFKDYSSTYGPLCAKNVNFDAKFAVDMNAIISAEVQDNKLWVWFDYDAGYFDQRPVVGYIDLASQTAPYDFVCTSNMGGIGISLYKDHRRGRLYLDQKLCLLGWEIGGLWAGAVVMASVDEDAYLKKYNRADYQDFPTNGVYDCILVQGQYIFALPKYSSAIYENLTRWGLMRIDTSNDRIDYFYPPWITSPENPFHRIKSNEEENEVLLETSFGIVVFNFVTETWERFENNATSALPPIGSVQPVDIAYSATRRFFFWSDGVKTYAIPRDGVTSTIEYLNIDSDLWSITSPTRMVSGYGGKNPALTRTAANDVLASWTATADTDTINWDKEAATISLLPYLTGETSLKWSIDQPGEVSFTLSHGHLFDQHNSKSILNTYVKKGKLISIIAGEVIDGGKVTVPQGSYIVANMAMHYARRDYPTIQVTAYDQRYLWGRHHVAVVTVDGQTPELALVDILTEQTAIEAANVTVPDMPLGFSFDAQWLDQTVADVIEDIAHRFQHFPAVAMDGTIQFLPITLTAESSLSIPRSQVISFSPNDDSSDLTNRITVTGEGLEDFEQVYPEEQISTISGTVGWWGYKNEFRIDYSQDKTATYKDPRLEVAESATGIMFKLAGEITEQITEIDDDNKYCVVTVSAPNLIPVLVGAIALYAAGNAMGDLTTSFGGMTIPVGRKMEGAGILMALMVLGSTGNFQYAIHGRPVGYVKRSYQASADDSELQTELGQVVENTIEGFLCHTPTHCQDVADFEMAVAMAERKKATVEMITHLQMEVGDTVTVTHPYTGDTLKLFITALTRAYKPASADEEGHIIDTIDGWVL